MLGEVFHQSHCQVLPDSGLGQDGLQAQAAGGDGLRLQILLLVAYHSTCFIISSTDSFDRLLPTTALA